MTESVDVVVVGMGPAGEEVAGSLAEEGLDVVGIESSLVGGECPYWGCVPSKMMIRAFNLLAESRRVDGMAGSSTVLPDWGVVAERIGFPTFRAFPRPRTGRTEKRSRPPTFHGA
jgi:pyruvate/2-oxoglutarate dehydrogenase complex dihydrolipoamide dehydrogenase (E3) component